MSDKPKISDLREVLDKIVSASISARINAVSAALQWYDKAQDYVIEKDKVDPKINLADLLKQANKFRDTGLKTFNLASSTNHGPERTNALNRTFEQYVKSIEVYQKICSFFQPPDIATYIKKYKEQKDQLEAAAKAANEKYESLLEFLNKVFTGFQITIDPSATADRWFDGIDKIVYNRKAAKEIIETLKHGGMLPAIKKEMMLFSRAKSIDATTKQYNAVLQVKAISTMLDDFIAFVVLDDDERKAKPLKWKLLKSGVQPVAATAAGTAAGTATATAAPKAPKVTTPKVKPAPGTKKSTIGDYTPGTAMHTIYERLKGGKVWKKKDLYAGLGASPHTFLAWVKIHGTQTGRWTVTTTADTAQMEMKQP